MTQEPTDHLPLLAEIIAAGTELTNGAKLDTNSQWLSRELTDDGLDVRWHTTVSDQLADVISALRIAVQRVAWPVFSAPASA